MITKAIRKLAPRLYWSRRLARHATAQRGTESIAERQQADRWQTVEMRRA